MAGVHFENWFSRMYTGKVAHSSDYQYYKHWLYTLAATIDCRKYEKKPSNVGYFSKIAENFSTALTPPNKKKLQDSFEFL